MEITPEVIGRMAKQGWSEAELLNMHDRGFRYSPSGDSLMVLMITEN